MKCIECGKQIGTMDEKCPFCGAEQYDPELIVDVQRPKRPKKQKEPMFTEEQCFFCEIHPDDETYRKILELNILSKSYK